jgi:hypothetical protein
MAFFEHRQSGLAGMRARLRRGRIEPGLQFNFLVHFLPLI